MCYRRSLIFSAVALALSSLAAPISSASTVADSDYGSLVFADSTRATCVIPLNPGRTVGKNKSFQENIPGCGFKWLESIWLENAKSAITLDFGSFWLSGTGGNINDCVNPGFERFSYRITLKTTGTYEKTLPFDINDILNTSVNQPVVPGVRLLSKKIGTEGNGVPKNHLFACVRITPSD